MDTGHEKQTSREIAGGHHTTVSREELVLVVPLIRIRSVVGIHVPTTVVVVPVRVHQARNRTSRIHGHLCHCPSITLGAVSYSGRHKSSSRRYQFSYVAFGILRFAHSPKAYPQRFRRNVFPKAWRRNRSRSAEFITFADYFIILQK